MSLKIIIPPEEIITAEEAADFLHLDNYAAEQETIEAMITAARQWCEEYLRRAIGIQTLELLLDQFPSGYRAPIILRPPVVSVVSMTYIDTDGVSQTLVKDTDFILSSDADPGEIRPIDAWPVAYTRADAVRVRFQTGYYPGGSPVLSAKLPSTIKTAMLMQVADLYNNRESQVEKPLSANPTLERFLSMYRLEMSI